FRRVASALAPGGLFAFLDVVVAKSPVSRPVPIEPGVDLPSSVDELLGWLREADLDPLPKIDEADLAVITADRRLGA
ncbi:MAG: class I SAM-dependent methyltransferase, partial [Nitrososphaerales archaeon]